MKILLKFFKRSLHDLAQVLMRRFCGDPGAVLPDRSWHQDLEDAMR